MQWTTDTLYAEQLRLEQAAFDGGAARYQKQQQRMHDSGESSASTSNRRLSKEFIEPLKEGIAAYLTHARSTGGRTVKAVPYLECVPADILAFLTVKTVLDFMPTEASLQQIAVSLGGRVEDQARFTKVEDAAPKYVKAVKETLKRVHSRKYKHRREVMAAAERKLSDSTGSYAVDIDRWAAWPEVDLLYVGLTLIEVMQNTLVFDDEPVFRLYRRSRRDFYHLKVSAKVTSWCQEFDDFMQYLAPEFSPCVIQPREWKHPKNGGYFMPEVARTLPLVKTDRREHLDKLTKGQMPEVYKAVNALQAVQWDINTNVLGTAQDIRAADLGLAMPQAEPFIPPTAPVREELKGLKGAELAEAMTADELAAFKEWKNEARSVYERENTRASKFMTVNRTLKAAETFSRYPCVYFVYTLDSRGRVYCRSSQFSPQGDDLQKALVHFHNACPLGEHGRYWLAVQGANTWGEDKAEFDDRVSFIEGFEETIRDIAADPLTFRDWANADEPWQFLAWCFEWNALLEHEDKGREAAEFLSRIPVAQDGSCSGIQHYSAMLKDKRGGAEVNLTVNKKPQDIYGAVAKVVQRKMLEYIEGDHSTEFNSMGKTLEPETVINICRAWLEFGVNRSLCKRPVMILPYGGTMLSTRGYIEEYISDAEVDEQARAKSAGRQANAVHPFGDNASHLPLQDAVAVCTKLVWQSIGDVVVAAKEGMAFIQKITVAVASHGKPIHWTTPTGFIVEQALYVEEGKQVKTQLLGGIEPSLAIRKDEIDPRRMRSSSAPNFVHSLDASHLVRAVNAFADNGLDSIAVVHDSFGTHAGKTETLRRELSRTFVELYQNDVLQDLKDTAEDITQQEIDLDVPFIGTLDLEETKRALYTFA